MSAKSMRQPQRVPVGKNPGMRDCVKRRMDGERETEMEKERASGAILPPPPGRGGFLRRVDTPMSLGGSSTRALVRTCCGPGRPALRALFPEALPDLEAFFGDAPEGPKFARLPPPGSGRLAGDDESGQSADERPGRTQRTAHQHSALNPAHHRTQGFDLARDLQA